MNREGRVSDAVRRPAPAPATPQAGTWSTLALAIREGRLLVTHPVALVALAFIPITHTFEPGPSWDPWDFISAPGLILSMWYGLPVYFAANRCASRARRAGTEEWLDAMPTSPVRRTAALCLACMGPFFVAVVLLIAFSIWASQQPENVLPPGPWRHLATALTVLGAGLLGVMVSQWFPFTGASSLVMIAIITAHLALQEDPSLTLLTGTPEWSAYRAFPSRALLTQAPPIWHAFYLLGLCCMAASGAFLTHKDCRGRALAVGAAATAMTAACAWRQLS
jgi:hypothetical protein